MYTRLKRISITLKNPTLEAQQPGLGEKRRRSASRCLSNGDKQ